MRIAVDRPEGVNVVTHVAAGEVVVNGQACHANLLLSAETIIDDWQVGSVEDLTVDGLNDALEMGPEVILLGTGDTIRFPHPGVRGALAERQIGLEVMDTAAACRTFNILVSEGRRVVAALILEQT